MSDKSLEILKLRLRDFATARDWSQFHSPKNLAMALCGETGELAAQFQWLTEEESAHLHEKTLNQVKAEIADVQLYLLQLADKLNIDIYDECIRKISENESKYPVDKAKGSAKKYTEL